MKQKILTQGYSPKGLKLGVSCDADWESRVDRILNSLPEFEMRDYGSSLSEIFVILMCRDPDFNFKRRIRLSK